MKKHVFYPFLRLPDGKQLKYWVKNGHCHFKYQKWSIFFILLALNSKIALTFGRMDTIRSQWYKLNHCRILYQGKKKLMFFSWCLIDNMFTSDEKTITFFTILTMGCGWFLYNTTFKFFHVNTGLNKYLHKKLHNFFIILRKMKIISNIEVNFK